MQPARLPRLALLSIALAAAGCSGEPDSEADAETIMANEELDDLLSSDATLSTFAAIIDHAQLQNVFDGPESYTIVVPDNSAFEAMPETDVAELTEEGDGAKAAAYVLPHILPGYVSIEDLDAALDKTEGKAVAMKTMAGTALNFTQSGDDIAVSIDDGEPVALVSGKGSENGGLLIVNGLLTAGQQDSGEAQ